MRIWMVVGALAFVALVSLVGLRLAVTDDVRGITEPPVPIVVTAKVESAIVRSTALGVAAWSDPVDIPAPSASGLVTEVFVREGDTLESGQPFMSIDGIKRVVLATRTPFWRSLEVGDEGTDVLMLQAQLQALGYFTDKANGEYDAETGRAVRDWAKTLGASHALSFDQSWAIWLPYERITIGKVLVAVGSVAPTPGAPIAESSKRLERLELKAESDADLELDDPSSWVIELDGESYDLESTVPIRTAESDLESLSSQLDPEAESIPLRLRSRSERSSVVVPVSAVATNHEGTLCVWLADTSGYRSRVVELGSSAINEAYVTVGLNDGDQVLMNPGQILDDPACPSG